MNSLKVVSIVGARPQFIKAAMISRKIREYPNVEEIMIHTGQHYDANMSEIFFTQLDLAPPQYNLAVGSESHAKQTAEMLLGIEKVLLEEQPQWIIIYGDTNSTLAGALVAAKLNIPIAHVEAGLRSFNRQMPEEINRLIADQLSQLLFAPTKTAVENLQQEAIAEHKIHLVGDVMFDAMLYYSKHAAQYSTILDNLNLQSKQYILATVHRQENTDNQSCLEKIMQGLQLVAKDFPIILPLHPRTRKMLEHYNLLKFAAQFIQFIDPVGFLDMIVLQKNARVIATDSGGIQKEAFFCGVPCVTLRTETEWVELVEAGYNIVVAPHDAKIIQQAILQATTREIINPQNLYGDGQSAHKMVEILIQ